MRAWFEVLPNAMCLKMFDAPYKIFNDFLNGGKITRLSTQSYPDFQHKSHLLHLKGSPPSSWLEPWNGWKVAPCFWKFDSGRSLSWILTKLVLNAKEQMWDHWTGFDHQKRTIWANENCCVAIYPVRFFAQTSDKLHKFFVKFVNNPCNQVTHILGQSYHFSSSFCGTSQNTKCFHFPQNSCKNFIEILLNDKITICKITQIFCKLQTQKPCRINYNFFG